jgi:hypothetical protein
MQNRKFKEQQNTAKPPVALLPLSSMMAIQISVILHELPGWKILKLRHASSHETVP